jgi:hypothetical protein
LEARPGQYRAQFPTFHRDFGRDADERLTSPRVATARRICVPKEAFDGERPPAHHEVLAEVERFAGAEQSFDGGGLTL